MSTKAQNQALNALASQLQIIPDPAYLASVVEQGLDASNLSERGDSLEERGDASLAMLVAQKLISTYNKVLEEKYPELLAESGDLLPIDTSHSDSDETWEQFQVKQFGHATWISDEGQVAGSGYTTMSRSTGTFHRMGFHYRLNLFDVKRATQAGKPVKVMELKNAKRAHAHKTNWVWMFGDSAKSLNGLLNHPNVPRTVAPLNAGQTSRLWENKTNEEILTDIAAVIDPIPVRTRRQYFATTVYMPLELMQLCQRRRLSSGVSTDSGERSLWEYIKGNYSGDDTGQGKVEFKIMNECSANGRQNPETFTDDSGIVGDFLFAKPADSEDNTFIRTSPFTQLAPEIRGFAALHHTWSRIGGARVQTPLAFNMLVFGIV